MPACTNMSRSQRNDVGMLSNSTRYASSISTGPYGAIDAEKLLPDMMSYNPSKPAGYPNGRLLTDHVVAHRLAFISKGEIPPDGLKPHSDLLEEVPYLGTPHPH